MSAQRPFRFGLEILHAPSLEQVIAQARQAEALRYATVLIMDHVHFPLAPITTIAAVAEATSTVRIGSFVFGNDFRHPVVLAREAATLDLLSGGRLELGLGTGYAPADYVEAGVPLDPPGVRVSRLAEAVQVIKGLFADDPLTFSGTYYTVRGLTGLPKPVQRPHPPLMIGGGARRTLSLAAREADIVSVNIKTTATGGFDFASVTAEATMQKVEWVRAAAGGRLATIEMSILVLFVMVTDNRQQGAEQVLHDMVHHWGMPAGTLSVEHVLDSPVVLIGTVDQIVDELVARRELYGFSYIAQWAPMEEFAPVVARLAGK